MNHSLQKLKSMIVEKAKGGSTYREIKAALNVNSRSIKSALDEACFVPRLREARERGRVGLCIQCGERLKAASYNRCLACSRDPGAAARGPRPDISAITPAQLIPHWNADTSFIQIAAMLGVSDESIKRAGRHVGLPPKPRTKRRCGPLNPRWRGGRFDYGPTWTNQRRLARERDKNTCQRCEATSRELGENCHVHHVIPFREFDDSETANQLINLICLCWRCHRIVEDNPAALHDPKPISPPAVRLVRDKAAAIRIEFCEDYQSGTPWTDLCEKYDRSQCSLVEWLRAAGLRPDREGKAKFDYEKIRQMWKEGMKVRAIAAALGCSTGPVFAAIDDIPERRAIIENRSRDKIMALCATITKSNGRPNIKRVAMTLGITRGTVMRAIAEQATA